MIKAIVMTLFWAYMAVVVFMFAASILAQPLTFLLMLLGHLAGLLR